MGYVVSNSSSSHRVSLLQGRQPNNMDGQIISGTSVVADNQGTDGLKLDQPGGGTGRPRRQSEGGAITAQKHAQRREEYRLTFLLTPPQPPPVVVTPGQCTTTPTNLLAPTSRDYGSSYDHQQTPGEATTQRDQASCNRGMPHIFNASPALHVELRSSGVAPLSMSADTVPVRSPAAAASFASPLYLSGLHGRPVSSRRASIGRKSSNADASSPAPPSGRLLGSPTQPHKRSHHRSWSRGTSDPPLLVVDRREIDRESKKMVERILAHFVPGLSADHPLAVFKKTHQASVQGVP